MNIFVLAALLVVLTVSYSPVVVSDEDFVKLVGQADVSLKFQQIQDTEDESYWNQASWITFNNLASHKDRNHITLESLFVSDCPGKAQLQLTTASLSFTAYLNEKKIDFVDDVSQQWSSPVGLSCGTNNMTLVLTLEKQKQGAPGLAFAITQNQSHCYTCVTPSAYYNRKTCSCQCLTPGLCEFTKNKKWLAYPICACPCTNEKQANCKGNFYFDHKRCKCMCKRQYCVPGYRWNRHACECLKKKIQLRNKKI